MAKKCLEIFAIFLLMLGLAVWSTYPLILYFDTGLPYSPFGGAEVWNRSGDQIQLMYWFWLVKENFLGAVPFDSNPFEFNMGGVNELSGLNTIPLAFLYMLFSPLGDIAAYNSSIITSYLLSGVFMYLLVRLYCGSRTGALLAALIFTFAPSRIRGFTAGHGYGFLYFCYPFILYFLEKGIRSQKIWYGCVSAIGLLGLSMLEPHLIYYFCVFLGLYLPVRVISLNKENLTGYVHNYYETVPSVVSLVTIWGAGAAVTVYSQSFFTIKDHAPFFSPAFWWVIGLYPFIFVLISLCFTALYQFLSTLSFQESLWLEAKSLMPLYLFIPLIGVFAYNGSIYTDLVVLGSLVAVFCAKVWQLRKYLYGMLRILLQGGVATRGAVFPVFPLVFAMGAIVYWMSFSKVEQVAETIAGRGRTLADVGNFSAHVSDLFSSISNVYIGVVTAALCGGFVVWLLATVCFGKENRKFVEEAGLLPLFFMTVAFCCLVLSLGLAFGDVSLYSLFFHYFPFFNYPRVSDRIITLGLFGLAIVCGYVVKNIQQRCVTKTSLAAVTALMFVAMGVQLYDFNILKPMGINILDKGQDVYTYVKKNIGDGLLLEIPLWPGDSHQSSLYQHYIMVDSIPRINGSSPMVLKEYVDTIFYPLESVNQGRLDREQFELLHKLGVKYITVHDNRDIFLEKVSPFVPLTTRRRLANSPYLQLIEIDNFMHFKTFSKKSVRLSLFRVLDKESVQEDSEQAWYDMPYYYGVYSRLHRQTGEIANDESLGHNVFQAVEGKDHPGFLIYGPYDIYPPGYESTFSLSTKGEKGVELARLEIAAVPEDGNVAVLAQKVIRGTGEESGYVNYTLPHSIEEKTKLEFRVYYYGKGSVRVDKIKVNKVGKPAFLSTVEAERMVGNTGSVVLVQGASGGKTLETVVGQHKRDIMVYGPNRAYAKGSYTIRFFLRRIGPMDSKNQKSVASEIAVTDGQGLILYAKKKVKVSQLSDSLSSFVELGVVLPRDDDLSFRVTFLDKVSLQLDKIEILPQ